MFVRSQGMQVTPALQARIDAAMISAAPARIFDVDSKVRLFTAGPAPAFTDQLVAAFTQPTFNGYGPVTLATPTGPVNLPNTSGMVKTCNFVATTGGSIPGEDIAGYLVHDTDGTTVLGWELFPQPIPIAAVGDSVLLDLIIGTKSRFAGEQG